ncbi:MAG: class II fructose-bisphosphate aldolase [Ruminococcaceae bacterium]|nr:class II fructose-bisphosphate aldolase [Oscillospiraceae bacterium]
MVIKMLVNLDYVLSVADKGKFCVPAFNVYNMETVMGVIEAAEEAKAPVILQVYPRLINGGSGYYLAPIILAAAKQASVPVCFHLDHGPSEKEVIKTLRYGATGIMIDGSAYPFDENVALTKKIVEMCHDVGVPVEGELGHIGSVNDEVMDEFTSPDEAGEFVKLTGVSCLAVLIGNAHGHYKKPPKLDIDRVGAIHEAVKGLPLVLHGGSGIPEDQVKAAIKAGVRKMNIGTDVCCAFIEGVGAEYANPAKSIGIDLFMKNPIECVKKLALEKIYLTGANGKSI